MDIISHGLWGSVAFGRKNKKSFWTAFIFGVAPDFLAFAPFFTGIILGIHKWPGFSTEPPPAGAIPNYVYQVYNFSHSLVIFAVVFIAAWLIFKKPVYEMLAWPLHIIFDIPTHAHGFFPTPFLWPIFNLQINGIPWAHPIIFIPNLILLAVLYFYFFVYKRKYKSGLDSKNFN